MEMWNASTLMMPTGGFETTITRNLENAHTSVSDVSVQERNGSNSAELFTSDSQSVPLYIPEWSPSGISVSSQVRIVECLGAGIYRAEWMTNSSNDGLNGLLPKAVEL